MEGFYVGFVLFSEEAIGEGIRGVGGEDFAGTLQDDDAAVYGFVDEVDGAAGDRGTVFEGLALGVEAGEVGQQRGVDVEHATVPVADEAGGEDAHVAGEADEVDAELVQQGVDGALVLLLFAATAFKRDDGDAEGPGGFDTGGSWDVGDDYRDLAVLQAAVAYGPDDGHAVGAAAGDEDGDASETWGLRHSVMRVSQGVWKDLLGDWG